MSKTTIVNIDIYTGDDYTWIGDGIEPFQYSFYPYQCPFEIGKDGTLEEVIAKFRKYFYRRLKTDPSFRGRVHELWGRVLGCKCSPDLCHGDIIAEYLNSLTRAQAKT